MDKQEDIFKTFDLITQALKELADKQKVIHEDIKKILLDKNGKVLS